MKKILFIPFLVFSLHGAGQSATFLSDFEDHVEVIADISNNPNSSLQTGEQNYDLYFSAPPPAQSIEIGVGLKLRS